MAQTHFLEQLYLRFFPYQKKRETNPLFNEKWDILTDNERKELSFSYLTKGNELLDKNDLNALDYFEAASYLDSENPALWQKQGLSFYQYGKTHKKKKAFLIAAKQLKMASKLEESSLQTWWTWGNVLFELGHFSDTSHYLNKAKEKFQKAATLLENSENDKQAQFYWDYAICLSQLADITEEAYDVRKALQIMKLSFSHQSQICTKFWHDYGQMFIQMGLLINDPSIYQQAIDYFQKALTNDSEYHKAWISLAEAYTQLYIITQNEVQFSKADECYHKATSCFPNQANLWLDWAQLLCESGKITKNQKRLRQSMDCCIVARKNDANNPLIISQWIESQAFLGAYTSRLDLIAEAENKMIEISENYSDLPEIWYAYGMCMQAYSCYYNDLDYEEIAIEKFQTGLSLDRSYAELWHACAQSYMKIGKEYEEEEHIDKACKFYQQALHLKTACASLIYDYVQALIAKAEMKENAPVLEKAIHLLETILHNQKDIILQHPEWLFSYGYTLDLLGDAVEHEEENCYAKAIETYQNVLLIDPDYPNIHYYLALSFSHLAEVTLEKEHFEKAFNYFRLAIKQDEENQDVWLEWGLSLAYFANIQDEYFNRSHYFQEAESKLLMAGKLGNLHTYYHLACLYSLTNRFNQSFMMLKQAHAQDVLPELEEIMQDEWMENMRETEIFTQFIQQLEESSQPKFFN